MNKYRDCGLLLLRVGIGVMFIYHGYSKFFGGPQAWTGLGGAMGYLGIKFAPAFWGLMAAAAEFLGGILLIVGLGFKVILPLMFIDMVVAATMHFATKGGMSVASHAIELAIVFLSLIFIGPGKLSLDEAMKSCACQKKTGHAQ
jgi:putative oxidoreductase